jgi:hypothetical protein
MFNCDGWEHATAYNRMLDIVAYSGGMAMAAAFPTGESVVTSGIALLSPIAVAFAHSAEWADRKRLHLAAVQILHEGYAAQGAE